MKTISDKPKIDRYICLLIVNQTWKTWHFWICIILLIFGLKEAIVPKQPKVSRDEAAKLLYFSAEVPQPDEIISRIRAIIRLREEKFPRMRAALPFFPHFY